MSKMLVRLPESMVNVQPFLDALARVDERVAQMRAEQRRARNAAPFAERVVAVPAGDLLPIMDAARLAAAPAAENPLREPLTTLIDAVRRQATDANLFGSRGIARHLQAAATVAERALKT